MGGRGSKLRKSLKQREIDELAEKTHFSADELQALYEHFKTLSSSHEDDGVIDMQEFLTVLQLKDSAFSRRIFNAFDNNHNGTVDFREFVTCLSMFSERSSVDEKLSLTFKIYDIDGDGFIDKDELFQILKATLMENYMLDVTEAHMRELVEGTFREADANGDGRISFAEYAAMVRANPGILANFAIRADLLIKRSVEGGED